MARRKRAASRRSGSGAAISPSQAEYILERLRKDRRISASDVSHYLSELQTEIRQVEERLGVLRGMGGGATSGPVPRARRGKTAQPSARPAVSAKTMESRKLQGVYLSLIRRIAEDQRSQFRKIAQASGREEAIRKMRSELR